VIKLKKLFLGATAFLVLLVFAVPALAKGPADYNGLEKGKSPVKHLYLYEKDSDWNVVEDGAWGKLTFNEEKNTFVFNGHELEPETEYTLVHYMDTWPNVDVLDYGTTDEYGNVHLQGSWDVWSMKFWLVLSSDITGSQLTGWHPAEYLFEYNTL